MDVLLDRIMSGVAVYCCTRSIVVSLSVCLLFTFMSPAKTAQPIGMPFGVVSQVGPTYHVFDGKGKKQFWGTPYHDCAKTAEPTEMLFSMKTRVGPGNYVLEGRRGPSYPR